MRRPLSIAGSTSAISRPRGLINVADLEAKTSPITSPEAFEAMFGASPDLLCVRDLRGKLVRVNPSWSTLLGFSLDDLHGAPLLDLVHPEDIWATHDIMEGVNAERMVLGFINRYRVLDGGYRRFEWTARQFGDQVFGLGHQVAN